MQSQPDQVADATRNSIPTITKQALSVAEWCDISGLGVTTTYALINSGQLKSFKVGRRRLIRVADAMAFLAGEQA